MEMWSDNWIAGQNCWNMTFNSVQAKCQHILTHWGRVTHICIGILTIIGSDNGLSPEQRQAIIWTKDGILLTEP